MTSRMKAGGAADSSEFRRQHIIQAITRWGRYGLSIGYVVGVGYLCLIALVPGLRNHVWAGLRWFGSPGSYLTILTMLAVPVGMLALARLGGKKTLGGVSLLLLPAMATSALALGLSAFWPCHDDQSPFFAPLSWTLALFAGNVEAKYDSDHGACGALQMPMALELARLLAIGTTVTTALAAALRLFRSQVDRVAIWRARSLTVVVGIDEEAISVVRAIAAGLDSGETLVVITASASRACVTEARGLGARIREVQLIDPNPLGALRLWKKLDRLYLLAEDPAQNESRLAAISAAMDDLGDERLRLPLTVRIDDPWQAEVWRRNFFDGEAGMRNRRWVADAVGRYETTAAKLVRHLTTTGRNVPDEAPPLTMLICGLHPLTYALSSELAQLHREQDVYRRPLCKPPSRVTILALGANGFVEDHDLRQSRIAAGQPGIAVEARDVEPTMKMICKELAGEDLRRCAVVLSDPSTETHGTRLAARFPRLRIYQASTSAVALPDTSLVGRLYRFPISMQIDADAPQDVWERAAELIHEHYSEGQDRSKWSTRPWDRLDPFIRHSNRRQVVNALWLVEAAGHSWNSLESSPAQPLPKNLAAMEPLDQLRELGFERAAIDVMLRREHEDWCRFYFEAGWKYAETRCDERRRHDRLLPWDELMARDEELRSRGVVEPDDRLHLPRAQRSLASTLIILRTLGYRSVPKSHVNVGLPPRTAANQWQQFRRRGLVSAERLDRDWTWTTASGETMHAQRGDWRVWDDHGHQRSVAAELFEATHELVSHARYRRVGIVSSRQAAEEEVVATKEGNAIARVGDWVVRGEQGEQWPVPAAQFLASYEGPLTVEAEGCP